MKISRGVQYSAGIVIAVACLAIFFRGVDVHRLAAEFAKYNPVMIVFIASLSILSLWFRTIRWRLMLPTAPGTHKRKLFSIVVIAFMANNILPARMGEAARVLLLWRKNGYAPFVGIGSLVAERVFDMLTLFAFFFLPAFTLPHLSAYRYPAMCLLAAFAAGFLGLLLYRLFPKFMKACGWWMFQRLPRRMHASARKIGNELISNLSWLWDGKRVAAIILLSLMIEYSYALMIQMLGAAGQPFSALQAMLAQSMASLGAAIPLAPGYIGTLHAMLLQGLVSVGIGEDRGRAIAIIFHAATYLPVTALGLWYLFRTDVTLKDISQAKEKIDK